MEEGGSLDDDWVRTKFAAGPERFVLESWQRSNFMSSSSTVDVYDYNVE